MDKYNIKVIFHPRFHCELSPIEGNWGIRSNFSEKRMTKTLRILKLSYLNILNFKYSNLNKKLWSRFQEHNQSFTKEKSYFEILKIYFGCKGKENILEHRRISNTLIQ